MRCKPCQFPEETQLRRSWMSVLAKASEDELEAAWECLSERPAYHFLRAPETGLVMVQARMGGTGRPFNLGEMTVTRCAVRTGQGFVGHAYVLGRLPRRAELAALFDALLQEDSRREGLLEKVIHPLRKREEERKHSIGLKTAATKVDFFTMVRGDD